MATAFHSTLTMSHRREINTRRWVPKMTGVKVESKDAFCTDIDETAFASFMDTGSFPMMA
jgi:hypothetical protein